MSVSNVTLESRYTHMAYLPYNYVPNTGACASILIFFSISCIAHIAQAIWYRLWFLLPTIVLGDISEIIGWSARLWSSKNPHLLEPFLMQITTTIIAPTPMVAANFLVLGELIRRLGPHYSRLSPKWYAIVFVGCDIIALVVQAVGGASASTAARNHTSADPGGNTMLGGIVFQLAAIVVYMTLATEFIVRYLYDRPVRLSKHHDSVHYHSLTNQYKQMLFGLGLSSTFFFIRSVYRTCELSDGWTGRIISTQHLFNICDGAMILLATYTINFFHPGRLMGDPSQWAWGRRTALVPADVENGGGSFSEKKIAR